MRLRWQCHQALPKSSNSSNIKATWNNIKATWNMNNNSLECTNPNNIIVTKSS